ncbi:MAG: hypothetical protein ACREQ9_22225 [Candidatus Binatia bacterium]
METTGRRYCGVVSYSVSGDPVIQAQCHCRECQYVSGGSPNVTIGFPEGGIRYSLGLDSTPTCTAAAFELST